MDKNMITIALPKGRLIKDCTTLLERLGLKPSEDLESTRKLVVSSEDGTAQFIIVRDKDLPPYVDYGAADIGFVGKDVLMESERDLLEPIDLGYGYCRIVVAEPAGSVRKNGTSWSHSRVATKFPGITARHFAQKGEQVEIIPLYGSIELAPLVGLADRIVDLVSTGETLRQNNLVEVEQVAEITARLVVNRASLKIKANRLVPLVEGIRKIIETT